MKYWKYLCLCFALFVSAISFGACSPTKTEASVDLDGDGQIEKWETIYENAENIDRDVSKLEVVEISNVEGLKSINEKTDELYVYKLVKNIDCGGQTLAINLGGSILLGNNNVIKNFKLGACNYDSEDSKGNTHIYGLFYNGDSIYDVRLFVGNQSFEISDEKTSTIISPFINTRVIENIHSKGKISVNRLDVQNLGSNYVDVSLVSARLDQITIGQIHGAYVSTKTDVLDAVVEGEIVYDGTSDTHVRIGGICPYVNNESRIYNANIDVEISTNVYNEQKVGGVAGENYGFVSTAVANGKIITSYLDNIDNAGVSFDYKLGGIVGINSSNAELKNVTSNMSISFDPKTTPGNLSNILCGGVAGYNLGIINYAVSDAVMTITGVSKLKIGGIAGVDSNGIFNNILSRGSISVKNIKTLSVADMVGESGFSYFETCVITTNITIDNSAINSIVNAGLVTIFEDLDINSDIQYNALRTPNFVGILVAGRTKIVTKTLDDSGLNKFRFNLGLRNKYEDFKLNEDGSIVTETIYNEETESNKEIPVLETRIPDVYKNLNILDTYLFEKFSVSGTKETRDALEFTYAKDSKTALDLVTACSSSRLNYTFFVSDKGLGFKYGLNHNELNLGTSVNLSTLKFDLPKDKCQTKFFETKYYNGELQYFDYYFDNKCFMNAKDEMYSFINYLILSNTDSLYIPLKISKTFIESNRITEIDEEGNEILSETETLVDLLRKNIIAIFQNMLGQSLEPKCYVWNARKSNVVDGEQARYLRIELIDTKDTNTSYYFTFDIEQLEDENVSIKDDFIVYLSYKTRDVLIAS